MCSAGKVEVVHLVHDQGCFNVGLCQAGLEPLNAMVDFSFRCIFFFHISYLLRALSANQSWGDLQELVNGLAKNRKARHVGAVRETLLQAFFQKKEPEEKQVLRFQCSVAVKRLLLGRHNLLHQIGIGRRGSKLPTVFEVVDIPFPGHFLIVESRHSEIGLGIHVGSQPVYFSRLF